MIDALVDDADTDVRVKIVDIINNYLPLTSINQIRSILSDMATNNLVATGGKLDRFYYLLELIEEKGPSIDINTIMSIMSSLGILSRTQVARASILLNTMKNENKSTFIP